MNEPLDFERYVAGHIESEGVAPPGPAFYDELRLRAGGERQRPRWLSLVKEPPMRIDSLLAVGSPMARVSAVVVATMLLVAAMAGAGIAGARLLAADAIIVVAQDGSGDFTTISEAVATAQDGDTVQVRPGVYVEAIVVTRDIAIAGDGPVGEVIVEAPADGPTAPTGTDRDFRPAAYALLLDQSDATVSGLTFRGERSRVQANGGSPVFAGLVLEGVDVEHTSASDDYGSVALIGGSTATVRDSVFEGGNGIFVDDGSVPVVVGNALRSGASIGAGMGDGSVIRGNTITDPSFAAVGFSKPTTTLIEENVISGAPNGIWIGGAAGVDAGPTITANSITDGGVGVRVGLGAVPTITQNTISANSKRGISIQDGAGEVVVTDNDLVDNLIGIGAGASDARIERNSIQGGTVGVVLTRGATAALTDNTIAGATMSGVRVSRGASPTLTDNRICGNTTNLEVREGAEPITQGNDICPD